MYVMTLIWRNALEKNSGTEKEETVGWRVTKMKEMFIYLLT